MRRRIENAPEAAWPGRGRISLRDFYIRRTLRIWPLYYAVLALYVVLVLTLQRGTGRDHVFFHFFPGYLTFTYTWFAGWQASSAIFNFAWSLSVEEQFYLIWAGVLRVLQGALPMIIMCLMIGLRAATDIGAFGLVVPKDSLLWRMAAGMLVLDVLKPIFNRLGIYNPLLRFPVALVCTVLVAGLSYRFLETPFLRLKERFSQLRPVKSTPDLVAPLSAPARES